MTKTEREKKATRGRASFVLPTDYLTPRSLNKVGWITAPQARRTLSSAGSRNYLFAAALWILGGLLLAFLALPILRIYFGINLGRVLQVAASDDVLPSIGLSAEAAILSSLCAALLGVPLAYRLSRDVFPGKGLLEAVVDLPLAVPHSVAGIALLFVFGRQGILGAPLAKVGLQFWGTLAGIVVAMLFVSCPFMVNTARVAFDAVAPELEETAASMGASSNQTFRMVALPLATRGIFTGAMLTYARSLSEFGAVIVLAYYPMSAPVKIYDLFLQGGLEESTIAAALLLTFALVSFFLLRFFGRHTASHT